MVKKAKPINFNDIEKKYAKVNSYETYVVDVETNSVIKYNPLFDKKKIQALKVELFEKLKYSKEQEINFLENDFEFYNYIYFLTIKYFTHFKDMIADDFETQIIQMEKLVSTGLFELILIDVLPEDEMQKVFDAVLDAIELAERAVAIEEQFKLDMKKKTSNPVVRERLGING